MLEKQMLQEVDVVRAHFQKKKQQQQQKEYYGDFTNLLYGKD